jgi:hypothetical protein
MLEPPDDPGVTRQMLGEDFDGEQSAMDPMSRKVHLRHPAAADAAQNEVLVSDSLTETFLLINHGECA